jgi:hypothetical protein
VVFQRQGGPIWFGYPGPIVDDFDGIQSIVFDPDLYRRERHRNCGISTQKVSDRKKYRAGPEMTETTLYLPMMLAPASKLFSSNSLTAFSRLRIT